MSITLAEIQAIRQKEFLPLQKWSPPALPLVVQSSLETLNSKTSDSSSRAKERYWLWILEYAQAEIRIIDSISRILSSRGLEKELTEITTRLDRLRLVYTESQLFLESKIETIKKKLSELCVTLAEEDALIAQHKQLQVIDQLLDEQFILLGDSLTTRIAELQKTPHLERKLRAEARWSSCIEEANTHLAKIRGEPIPISKTQDPTISNRQETLSLGIKEFLEPLRTKLRSIVDKITEKEAELRNLTKKLKQAPRDSLLYSSYSRKYIQRQREHVSLEEELLHHTPHLHLLCAFFLEAIESWGVEGDPTALDGLLLSPSPQNASDA
ncbi:MAG: hypothetical protein KGZ30_02200 [Anaplasmataceae bacterium]|nr:hypothetical protein [Anaplasmataceae bacterium]